MGCTGCNDGCFDESVQLAQGPAGPQGPAGTDGSTTISASGTDISVTGTGTGVDPYIVNFTGDNDEKNVLETGVTQADVKGTFGTLPNPVINKVINGTDENINGIGDIIRLEFFIIGESIFTDSSSKYYYKINFGGNTVIDTTGLFLQLNKNVTQGSNSAYVTLDLIVSAADAVTPIIKHSFAYGERASKLSLTDVVTNRNDITQVLSPITGLTLSGDNTLSVELASSDGTSNISLMSYKIMKFLKA